MAGTTFNVMKKKSNGPDAKPSFYRVGTLIVRENAKSGVLFMNHLDGEFAVFPQREDDKADG